MPIRGHRGAGVWKGFGVDAVGYSLCEVDFPIGCNILKHLKTKSNIYALKNQHEFIHRISEYCEKLVKFGSNLKNLAQEISIW